MASDYQNLNFANVRDITTWKERCAEQRKIALEWPAFDPQMSSIEEYGWKLGPWSLRLVLEIWKKPYMWHGSAAVIEHIGYEMVDTNVGKIGVPQDALLSRTSWHPEHEQQADFLLNGMFGGLIRANDKSQQILVFDGLWGRHIKFRYEGAETWKKKQN